MTESSQALAGLRVLDLSRHIAGAYCTALLAGFGAEVVKIEPPGTGDPARRHGPFPSDRPHPERSGLFLYLNMGKRGITLDVQSALGARLFECLASGADIIVQDFAPRSLSKLGLEYHQLAAGNPGLILVSLSGFGQTGPYADYRTEELIACAVGGLAYLTGEPGREPLKPGGYQANYVSGLAAAIATLAAVLWREATGEGQHVDISMMEVIASILDHAFVLQTYQGETRCRLGDRLPDTHPTAILPCRDGFVAIAAQLPAQWENLVLWMDAPEMLADPRFATSASRARHADDLDRILRPWLAERTRLELFHEAGHWRIPLGYVPTVGELFDDPQYQAREFFTLVDHPETGCLAYPGAPFKLPATPWQAKRAPLLGEDNEPIYGDELGLTPADLTRLRGLGVI